MSKPKCHDWQHTFVAATSNIYEICQICKAVRKKPAHVLPVIEKKEGQEHESQPTENGRTE